MVSDLPELRRRRSTAKGRWQHGGEEAQTWAEAISLPGPDVQNCRAPDAHELPGT